MDNHDVIATLNGLLEISRDGEQGFHACAEGVQSANLKALLEAAARRCAEGAAELDAKVRSLGGEPAQGGSISGSMHRAWTNIKSTITG
ncbi:MAG TPA: PA2169 family four-helix-bundle protein, partial [Methylocella sp.]